MGSVWGGALVWCGGQRRLCVGGGSCVSVWLVHTCTTTTELYDINLWQSCRQRALNASCSIRWSAVW